MGGRHPEGTIRIVEPSVQVQEAYRKKSERQLFRLSSESTCSIRVLILAHLFIMANVHTNKYQNDPQRCMSSATRDTGSQIKRIPVKEPTWRDLHDLKEAGESYDDLLSRMIRRERDYRDWKMIVEIEEAGEFVAFDPDEILRDD